MLEEDTTEDYYPKQSKWLKALFVLIVLFGYSFVEALLWFLSIFQFAWVLFKGQPNEHVEDFGTNLIRWNSTAISYCLWKSDRPPFPFSKWSEGDS
tara:strand:- start:37 stop:324 length:288 start_codon:yes stop_codon:yes gene_type:complete